jgi:hypothetical protein
MTYALVSDWVHLLEFSAQFFKACENHTLSFACWDTMHSWHTRHLDAIHLQGLRQKQGVGGGGGGGGDSAAGSGSPKKILNDAVNSDDKGGRKNPVTNRFLRKNKLCLNFQKNTCDHEDDHKVGYTSLIHACGLCLCEGDGFVNNHGLNSCPKQDF